MGATGTCGEKGRERGGEERVGGKEGKGKEGKGSKGLGRREERLDSPKCIPQTLSGVFQLTSVGRFFVALVYVHT